MFFNPHSLAVKTVLEDWLEGIAQAYQSSAKIQLILLTMIQSDVSQKRAIATNLKAIVINTQ
jgi:hypothetical protein